MVDNTKWTVAERIAYLSKCSPDEWEEICKGCGICCLCKYEIFFGKILYSNIACNNLDLTTKKCRTYNTRLGGSYCTKVNLNAVLNSKLVPDSCGYVEFIFGPAKCPASVDFTKVVHENTLNAGNIFLLVDSLIKKSKNWNMR